MCTHKNHMASDRARLPAVDVDVNVMSLFGSAESMLRAISNHSGSTSPGGGRRRATNELTKVTMAELLKRPRPSAALLAGAGCLVRCGDDDTDEECVERRWQ